MRPILVLALLLAALTGCAAPKDRSGLRKGVKTHDVTLECIQTDISDLKMTVPAEFEASDMRESEYDKFLIGRSADVGSTDTAGVVSGQIVVTVTPYPSVQVLDSMEHETSIGVIGEKKIEWREVTTVEEGYPKVYLREFVSGEVLEHFNAHSTMGNLKLHVFVSGSDRNLVERLMAFVETMTIQPAKPNV